MKQKQKEKITMSFTSPEKDFLFIYDVIVKQKNKALYITTNELLEHRNKVPGPRRLVFALQQSERSLQRMSTRLLSTGSQRSLLIVHECQSVPMHIRIKMVPIWVPS